MFYFSKKNLFIFFLKNYFIGQAKNNRTTRGNGLGPSPTIAWTTRGDKEEMGASPNQDKKGIPLG